jgi:capsular polysaccharide transport system permease protein
MTSEKVPGPASAQGTAKAQTQAGPNQAASPPPKPMPTASGAAASTPAPNAPAMSTAAAVAVAAQPAATQPKPLPASLQPATAKPVPSASIGEALQPLALPKLQRRHRLLIASFALIVAIPSLIAALYLMIFAANQYHSRAAFSVRSENFSGTLSALSAFTQIGSTSAPESAILYDYIRSQELMEQVDAKVDLTRIFNRAGLDFYFRLGRHPTSEEMLRYWQSMIQVTLDQTTSILTLEVHAFTPEDAVAIAQQIIENSSGLVNRLSAIAREDTLAASAEDLAEAQDRLREASRQIRVFREENSIIDPSQDVMGQMGLLGALQSQLASVLVEKETILPQVSSDRDPRLSVIDRKIAAIRNQIAEERARVREPEGGNQALSAVIGQYEALRVEEEFARTTYTAAMAALEAARAEARRQSRYLAVHINPTLADDSLYPRRALLAALVFLGLFAAWSVMVLAYYNMRDRS